MFAIIAGACSDTPVAYAPVRLADLERDQVEAGNEWRTVWKLPAGQNRAVRLPVGSSADTFRVGLFAPEGFGEGDSSVAVVVGSEVLGRVFFETENRWADARFPLPDEAGPGNVIELRFESGEPVWIWPCETVPAASAAPPVVVFLVDTLRQDHLGCYGYPRDTSPNLDAFARDAVVFTQAIPQSSWTRPSVASLMTSRYPAEHGVQDQWDRMRTDLPTLAQALGENGYETHGFMANPNCLPTFGHGIHFARYADVDSKRWRTYKDALIVDAAIAAMRHAQGRPWFVYVHAMGPHGPYTPPDPFAGKFQDAPPSPVSLDQQQQDALNRYDGEIAYTDREFGRFVAEMKTLGVYDDSLIIVVSDHGEEFWEHGGVDHGKTLFEEQLRVPLIVKLPGNENGGKRRDAVVELVDVAPSILAILGLPAVDAFRGQSFTAALTGPSHNTRPAYAALNYQGRAQRTVRTAGLKMIEYMLTNEMHWYDLSADPLERQALATAPDAAKPFVDYARLRSVEGADGLHVLFVTPDGTRAKVSGTVDGTGLGAHELRLEDAFGTADRAGDAVRFELRLGLFTVAELCVKAGIDATASIEVAVNGQPLPAKRIVAGNPWAPIPDTAAPTAVTEWINDTAAKQHIPEIVDGVQVFVWYVPPVDVLDDADQTPELTEALDALGYL